MAGRTVATINRWAAAGKITPVHKGKGIRGTNVFTRADLDKFLKSLTPTK